MTRNNPRNRTLRHHVVFLLFVPLLACLPECGRAVTFEQKAFLPAAWCTSVDISPDRSTIYARAHFADWNEGVRLYDAATYQHIKDFENLPSVPWTILASADGNHLYATYYYGGAVVKINASTGQVVRSISVGPWPGYMAFDSSRRFLYVGVNCPGTRAVGWISVIDTSSDTVVGRVDLNGEPGHFLVLSPDNAFLYNLSWSSETLFKISTAEKCVVNTLAMPGVGSAGMSIIRDGKLLYVADYSTEAVRIIDTDSLVQTGSYSIPQVQNFSVAPSGEHALAIGPIPGTQEIFVKVVELPSGSVVQSISWTLTGSTQNLTTAVPVRWDPATGRAFVTVHAENGGVIVLGPAEEGPQVVYETDFSTDPGWTADQPDNYYWNESAGTFHAKVENNAPDYQPNRYFYTPVTWTDASFELQWDVKVTRMDWSAGVCFGMFDESIALGGFGGGQGVHLVFGHPDEGLVLAFYAAGAGGLASADSKGGPRYSTDVWYACKISYDPGAGKVSVEVVERDSGSPLWSKALSVPAGFTRPLVRLGGSWSGFGETSGGYSGVNRWAVAEAEIDNVVFKRTGVAPQPPAVLQLAINNGAETTESRTVALNNTTQNNPTDYIASEKSDFAGATWQPYSAAAQFTLSAADGAKTVYFKTKNEAGESNVVSDSITLTTPVPPNLQITTTSLPSGVAGQPYAQTLQATGGVPSYTWSIVSGSLPDGLSLDPSTGVISGTPTTAAIGTSTFTVRVNDSYSAADTIYVFGGLHDAYATLSSAEKYDPIADAWTFASPMNEPRCNAGFCTDDHGRLYAIAGQSENVLQTVERYDPARDEWEYLAPLPIAVGGPAAFTLNGEVYAVGGWMPGYTNRCFIYSPGTNTWREGPSVYETFGHAGPVISLSGVPYLIGGHMDRPSWSIRSGVSVLVREGPDLVWKPTTPLQRRRTGAGVTLGLDGLIYAIGGDQEPGSSGHLTTETVERFDEATKAWEYVQSMPAKRAFAGAVTDSSGRIWVVGGTDNISPTFLDSVLYYDPGTDSWTAMTSHLNTGRGGHGMAIVRGRGQTDDQELSITIVPGGPWQVVYQTDFSSDPHWVAADPKDLSWDPVTETFHGWQANTNTSYAYVPAGLRTDCSFRLEFDARINSVEWSAGLTFGLFDQRLIYNAGVVIDYSLVDAGYITALYAGNPSGPPDWEVSNWETGVWYRNVIEYDAQSHVLSFEARRRDSGELFSELSLSGIRSLPPGMVLLGVSRLHMEGYNDSAVDFSLDNVTLKQLHERPKYPVEILRLAGPLLRISWDSESGVEYQLWATSDFVSGEWGPVGPRMGGTGAKLYVDDYVKEIGQRFYRLEIISPFETN